MGRIFRALFACRHRTISRVFTNRETSQQYVVCMDCCGRFAYDWQTMTIGERLDDRASERVAA